MPSSFGRPAGGLRRPVVVGIVAGALTALAVFGGTGAFLAAAQDSPDTTVEPQGPDTTVPPEDQAPSQEDRQAEMDAWRQCMADNGVDLPEPQLDENGRPTKPPERPQLDESQREAFEAAIEACGRPPMHRHGHGGPGFGRGGPGCDGDEHGPDGTAPDESGPDDTAPSAEGSPYSA